MSEAATRAAIRRADNPFKGINPLLNSLLQMDHVNAEGDPNPSVWPSFHASHIGDMTNALNQQIKPLGYIALAEQGLQIGPGEPSLFPDDTIYELPANAQDAVASSPIGVMTAVATARLPVAEIIEMSRVWKSVAIYPAPRSHGLLGEPLTRIELLSPTNKPGGRHYAAYVRNRAQAVQTGTALIEIDYLHESSHTFPRATMPRYPEDGAYPYHIAITNVRVAPVEMVIYGFGVDQPIPPVGVPLAGDIVHRFDLNAVYQFTFQIGPWPLLVDYRQVPARIERYSAADQATIRRIMQELAAHDADSQQN
jgi:hypothetical protein